MSEKESFLTQASRVGFPIRLTLSRVLAALVLLIVFMSAGMYQYPEYTPQMYNELLDKAMAQAALHPESLSNQHSRPEPEAQAISQLISALPPVLSTTPFLPPYEAELLCNKSELKVYPHQDRHRKVYDLFLVGTELDWVEIRINELAPYVDYFVIVESTQTFTNHTKPLYFKENFKMFDKFQHQIIYHLLNDEAAQWMGNPWDREHFQRNALLNQVFPSLIWEQAPNQGDVLLVSDVDEIPRPESIEILRNCDFPERTGLRSRFYLYSFQWHRDEGDWGHPQATFWQGNNTIIPESLRMTQCTHWMNNASWHCTTCFETVAELVYKVESFSHQEWNKPEFKDPEAIVRRVRNGTDVFDRGFKYEKFPQDQLDVPEYLRQNRDKFAYLLDRDPPDANFRDYVPPSDSEEFHMSGN